ncbi:MAG TPA: fatty acid desaturase [Cyanobium sp.]|nr:fatty acid desaturase [Cyanobium sp.]
MTEGLVSTALLTPLPEAARESRVVSREDFELKPFMGSSNGVATWQIVNTLIPYGLLWWGAWWCRGQAPWLLLPVMGLMALFLARCFSLMHDCGHGSLFRHRRANRIVGFVLGVVCGIPQLPWSRGHAFHHRHNGDWEKYQGPSALVTTTCYDQLTPPRQRLYRVLRHPLMLFPGGFFYLVIKPRLALLLGLAEFVPHAIAFLQRSPEKAFGAILAGHRSRHWHSPEEFQDLLLNNLAVIALWLGMGFTMGAAPFWLIYGPVMSIAAAIFICIFFVQHNFPGSYAHPTEGWSELAGALEGTSDLDLPGVFNWFSADIGCHSIHHLCAAIPNYRLRACHDRNRPLLGRVTRLRLADIPGCFGYILWDPSSCQLTTIPARPSGVAA